MTRLKKLLHTYSSHALLFSIVAAILITNHDLGHNFYKYLKQFEVGFKFGNYDTSFSIKFIVENFLIVFFFYLIGLELKKETVDGQLQNKDNFFVLSVAALFGVLSSSTAFYYLNQAFDLNYSQAWAIPITTDTAIAIGIISLLRKNISKTAISFLLGIAIFDDIYSLIIIAIFYSDSYQSAYIAAVLISLVALYFIYRYKISSPFVYLCFGILFWFCLEQAGLHGTLAGFIVALFTPIEPPKDTHKALKDAEKLIRHCKTYQKNVSDVDNKQHEMLQNIETNIKKAKSPLKHFENILELPVSILILPLYAFLNSGIRVDIYELSNIMLQPLFLILSTCLVLFKPLGVYLGIRLAGFFNSKAIPESLDRLSLILISVISGIGFTMSIYITNLTLNDPSVIKVAKTAILFACSISICCAIVLSQILRLRL